LRLQHFLDQNAAIRTPEDLRSDWGHAAVER
jgi:hypothetical protein